MKKIIIGAATAALFSTSALAGPSDTQDFDINATVTPECSMESPGNIDLGALSIDEDPGEGALLLDNPSPSDPVNMFISCNTDATFSVNTLNRRLLTTSPVTDTDQFTNSIRYDIRLTPDRTTNFGGLGSYKPRVQAPGAVGTSSQPTGEFHANYELVVGFEAPNVNNKRPVAGTYTETVTFTIAAI